MAHVCEKVNSINQIALAHNKHGLKLATEFYSYVKRFSHRFSQAIVVFFTK